MDNNNLETNNSYYQEDTLNSSGETVQDDKADKADKGKVKKGSVVAGVFTCIGTIVFVRLFGLLGLIFLAIAALPMGALAKTKLPFALKIIIDVIIGIVAIVLYIMLAAFLSGIR